MNAIRKDEEKLSNIHSIYVDQYDWERVIDEKDRTPEFLKQEIQKIYGALRWTEIYIHRKFPQLGETILPLEISFVTSQELEDRFPDLQPDEREHAICREMYPKSAVFITQIGGKLKSGQKHSSRSCDYDDWKLNGDMLIWYPLLNRSIEVSSMGIRVNSGSLISQTNESNCANRLRLPFHQSILNNQCVQCIGGGIGMSRICMIILKKAHIGEVQCSVWDKETLVVCENNGIQLL
jgi:aspartate--ammonia ligase